MTPSSTMAMDDLAQRQATQLRLNAELDAGALAAISDVETCLRAPLDRPSNVNNKKVSGNSSNGNSHINRPGSGATRRERLDEDSKNGNARGTSTAFAARAGGGRERGRGRGKVAATSIAPASASAQALVASSSGRGARPAMSVSRGPGGAAWDNTNPNPNIFSAATEADDQLFRVEQEARRAKGHTLLSAVATVGGGRDGTDAGTPSTSSSLFRLSARVKGAARASGERTEMMKVKARTASGGSLSISPRPEDEVDSYGKDISVGPGQEHEGLRLAGMRPGSSKEEGRRKQRQHLARSNEDVEHHDRNRDGNNGDDNSHRADTAVIPSEGFGIPAGIGHEATARFLKAKLTSCQAQLDEALQARYQSQQEAVELRKQAASDQEQLRRVTRQLEQLQQTKAKESKAKEEESSNAASLSARVAELERELGSFRRATRQSETDKKSLEVRLHRALEEISKQKEAVRQTRGQNKDVGQGQRLEVSRLEGQCQRLERQKLELLSAFKKQLKLIDVLKRQKFHVEAARLLGFTEEDFVKTLDWDAKDVNAHA
eukprot:g12257.t1